MRRFLGFVLALALMAFTCAGVCEFIVEDDEEALQPNARRQARALMSRMTDEEKIFQLFFVSVEDLTGEAHSTDLKSAGLLKKYPVGGVILFGQNIATEEQTGRLTGALQLQAKNAGAFPLLIAVDEEGGAVSRIANKLGYPFAPPPEEIGKRGEAAAAERAGAYIAGYLSPLGVNMTFAPSADTVIDEAAAGLQTYGQDGALVSQMAFSMAAGLRSGGVLPCYTHFPGHGEKTGATANKLSVRRTLDEMRAQEWVPFRDAIDGGVEMILVSHAWVRAVGDDIPASTSYPVIQGLLRGELGFDGVVITDSLRMGAVTTAYKTGKEAVAALKAGADMLLLPPDLEAAVQAVRKAIQTGELTMSRVEDSVERILAVKIRMGLIQ